MLVTSENAQQVLDELATQKLFAVDIETNGLDVMGTDKIVGVGVGISNGKQFYFPIRHTKSFRDVDWDTLVDKWCTNLSTLEEIKEELASGGIEATCDEFV